MPVDSFDALEHRMNDLFGDEALGAQTSVRLGKTLQLAEQFQRIIQTNVQDIGATSVHIFMAAPVALAFLMGQLSRVFGPYTLYEWDFDKQRIEGGGYFPSISIPKVSVNK